MIEKKQKVELLTLFIVREEEVGTRNENQRVEGEHDIVEGVSDLIVLEFGPTHRGRGIPCSEEWRSKWRQRGRNEIKGN